MEQQPPAVPAEEAKEQLPEDTEETPELPQQTAYVQEQETKTPASELPKGLLFQVKRIAAPIPRKISELKMFAIECQRVLRVTKKPNREEFQTIVKISAVGMAVIGLLGFAIHAIKEIIF